MYNCELLIREFSKNKSQTRSADEDYTVDEFSASALNTNIDNFNHKIQQNSEFK